MEDTNIGTQVIRNDAIIGTTTVKFLPAQDNKNEVFAIELTAGVNFGGFVTGALTIKNDKGISLTEEAEGIRARGPKCNKLVPWGNLKGVDYLNEDGSEPLAPKSKI